MNIIGNNVPDWASGDELRENDEQYEATTVVADDAMWGEALRSGEYIRGTGIDVEDVA